MPEAVHDAFDDMSREFKDNCGYELNAAAGRYLQCLYDQNVEPIFQDGTILWAGREQKFMLSCAAGLGRATHKVVKGENGSQVDARHVQKAAKDLIECWQRVCPIPPRESPSPLESGCSTMHEFLGRDALECVGEVE